MPTTDKVIGGVGKAAFMVVTDVMLAAVMVSGWFGKARLEGFLLNSLDLSGDY